jgi:hypothetical protein
MGADPSICPNVAEIQQHHQQSNQPANLKVEIPNMGQFDKAGWELAFGNVAYEEQQLRQPQQQSRGGGS